MTDEMTVEMTDEMTVEMTDEMTDEMNDEMNDEFKFDPCLAKVNSSSCLVVIELTYHLSLAFARNIFFTKFLSQYGTCITCKIPNINFQHQEITTVKSYYLLDF